MDHPIVVDLARVARDLQLPVESVRSTTELLDSGNTVPFITRYRRDQTGGLDEEKIEHIRQSVDDLRQLEHRKATILRSLESQKKLTDELRKQVEQAGTLRRLEDLYLPFKPKKQSLAAKARALGLAPLADAIHQATGEKVELERLAEAYVTPATEDSVTEGNATEGSLAATAEEKKPEGADEKSTPEKGAPKKSPPGKNDSPSVADVATALAGAGHILAERFSEQVELRQRLRKLFRKTGKLVSSKVRDDHKKNPLFKDYFNFREAISRIPPHRILAINRGEKAKVIRVSIDCDSEAMERLAMEAMVPVDHHYVDFLKNSLRDALQRLLVPGLEREARRELTDKAEAHAVEVFARNLRALLLQPPVPGRKVLAVDPGYKNGCKLAMLDAQGNAEILGLIHITGSDEAKAKSREKLLALIREHQPNIIAIGNGSACRPTETLVAELLADELADTDLQYVIVNEAGASVYSTSAIGREEFPECEAIDRSAISIGRRLQDPLSELVKIDPASIGVGLYQHDAKPTRLRETLDSTVRSCVSFVGVDANTASAALLRNVAGLNQLVARRLIEHRTEQGPFRSRASLQEVKGLGEATFEQAAGFLKIEGGENRLDATWVHPESYEAAGRLLRTLGIDAGQVGTEGWSDAFAAALAEQQRPALAASLQLGEHALDQLIEALERPGRDLRTDLPPPVFRRDVVKLDDLAVGMKLRGTVLNVVDFGAFVDVGLTDSGLVHVSQLQNEFVRDPHEVVSVGDQVDCWVTAIDAERRRVALTMIEPGTERPKSERSPGRHKPRSKSTEGQASTEKAASGKATGRSSSQQGDSSRRGKPSRPRRPKKPGGGRRHEKPREATGSFEQRAKREVVPISKEMSEGKEALRSFGDLLQFHKEKKGDDKKKKDKKK